MNSGERFAPAAARGEHGPERSRRRGLAFALLGAIAFAFLALLPACARRHSATGGGPTGPAPVVGLHLRTITTALSFPVFMTAAPADTSRLFVVEKGGTIRIVKSNVLLGTPFLDIHTKVSTAEEQGLLGLAFDPNYAANGRFFVSYTDLAGNSRVLRYHVSANPDLASSVADDTIFAVVQPADNHNGGMIAFDSDGNFWYGLGDGGGGFDTYNNGQSKDDLLGSLLRVNVSGASGYTIPADNPFTGATDRRELWNYGLRNPWRWSFDRLTGDLYIGDVGQKQVEEVDVGLVANLRGRGANYGWPIMEGSSCLTPPTGCSTAGLTLPTLDYSHADGCAVTGGYVYRGSAAPSLSGTYFYADYCSHWVRSFRMIGTSATEQASWPTLDPGNAIPSFGQDASGELYLMTRLGGLYKIVPD